MRRLKRRLVALMTVTASLISTSLGQDLDTLVVGAPVYEFTRATHLGISPDGLLYIPDRDRSVIHVFSNGGQHLRQLGGPGLSEGQFDDPRDVDPALGLVVNVADTENGRIQRFTKEFRFIESLPVMSGPDDGVDEHDPSFRTGEAQFRVPADGRPIAVSSSPVDDLYVISAQANLVIRWDRERRNRWWIGRPGQGPGSLVEPVDLLATEDLLYVADQDCACVLIYDLFGTYVRTLSKGSLTKIRSVTQTPDGILAVMPDRLVEFDSNGLRIAETYVLEIDSLVDAVKSNSRWVLLTDRSLYFVPIY
ncbi:MAG: hypothetical protein BMS9Abin05_1923 [Rhodothermia bacterium]|nr:MAG: hypothetical protein BMS9Abin05_1923 [Rhodothermia bacterium]